MWFKHVKSLSSPDLQDPIIIIPIFHWGPPGKWKCRNWMTPETMFFTNIRCRLFIESAPFKIAVKIMWQSKSRKHMPYLFIFLFVCLFIYFWMKKFKLRTLTLLPNGGDEYLPPFSATSLKRLKQEVWMVTVLRFLHFWGWAYLSRGSFLWGEKGKLFFLRSQMDHNCLNDNLHRTSHPERHWHIIFSQVIN